MLAIFFVGAIVTYFMLPYDWFMEIIGFLATFIEAMLGKFALNKRKFSGNDMQTETQMALHSKVLPNFCATSKGNQRKACQL